MPVTVAYLISEQAGWSDDVLEEMLGDVDVDSTERIVEEIDVRVLVDSSGQTQPLSLSTAQISPLDTTSKH